VAVVVAGVLGLLAKMVYRPIVYSERLNDLGLHGILPNFFWAAFSALLFGLFSRSPGKACATAFVANVVYELDQLRHDGFEDTILSTAGRTFDPWDIVASAVGCVIAYGIMKNVFVSPPRKADA
jgi:hypothetical protein